MDESHDTTPDTGPATAAAVVPDVRPVPWVPVLAAAAVAALTFAVTLGGTFIYDDIVIIQTDERVHAPGQWVRFLTGPYWANNIDNLYRPLTSLSFVLEQRLHGGQAWALHLTNVLLHAGVSAAVAGLAGRFWGSRAAWVAGVLFAVHPVHTEAVAGLVGRAELLCALATLGGLLLCLDRPITGRRAAGVFGCFAVALLSKEQGMLFPLLVLLAIALPRLRGRPLAVDPAERRRLQLLGLALLWGLAGYILFRERILPFAWDRTRIARGVNPIIYTQGADRWLMPLVLVGRYLALLVAPARLSLDYGGDVVGGSVRWGEPYVYVGAAAVLAWAGLTAWAAARRRAWPVVLCLLALAAVYGTVSNLAVHIGTILGERLMYLPSAFFLALAGAAVARWPGRVVGPALAVLAALGAWRTVTYAALWNDKAALYTYTLETQPRSVQAYNLVFTLHAGRKDWHGALAVGRRCIERMPNEPQGYVMAAQALTGLGELDLADEMIAEAAARGTDQWVLAFTGTEVALLREERRRAAEAAAAATRPAEVAGPEKPANLGPPPGPAVPTTLSTPGVPATAPAAVPTTPAR